MEAGHPREQRVEGAAKPMNILFLMTDQMQGRVLEPGHPCQTPNLDALAARGTRFRRAYTPNAVCSPARASLMTGLLPHNHGVLHVTHCVDDDQSVLRDEHPHWAQQLVKQGYNTGYYGKWHIERTGDLAQFGWHTHAMHGSAAYKRKEAELGGPVGRREGLVMTGFDHGPDGYAPRLLYGVTSTAPERRMAGVTTALALDFLDDALARPEPWCCFVSVIEPHDPFICGEAAYAMYDIDELELPQNAKDDLAGRPGLYRKARRCWNDLTDRQRREAMACYYGSITEIDEQFGRLLRRLETAGVLDNTLVVMTSDHGELLGAHGMYTKNVMASEEVYHIPLVMAGPGVAGGAVSDARVGLHDLAPTLLEAAGCEAIGAPDSRSFRPLLLRPDTGGEHDEAYEEAYDEGYAEYHGSRILLTQRVVWSGRWKYIFNGFDIDELYDLEADPFELRNLAEDPASADVLRAMSDRMWVRIRETGDESLLKMSLRIPSYGPSR